MGKSELDSLIIGDSVRINKRKCKCKWEWENVFRIIIIICQIINVVAIGTLTVMFYKVVLDIGDIKESFIDNSKNITNDINEITDTVEEVKVCIEKVCSWG